MTDRIEAALLKPY